MSDTKTNVTDHAQDALAGKRLIACGGGACNILADAYWNVDVAFEGTAVDAGDVAMTGKFNDAASVEIRLIDRLAHPTFMLDSAMRDSVQKELRRQLEPVFDKLMRAPSRKEEPVILIACLGGFVGNWVTTVLSQGIAELGIPQAVIATMPFDFETTGRREAASRATFRLAATADYLFVFDMSSINRYAGYGRTIKTSLELANKKALELTRLATHTLESYRPA